MEIRAKNQAAEIKLKAATISRLVSAMSPDIPQIVRRATSEPANKVINVLPPDSIAHLH